MKINGIPVVIILLWMFTVAVGVVAGASAAVKGTAPWPAPNCASTR